MVFSAFCSPSPLSAASSGYKPKSAHLIPPDDGEKRTGNTSNQSKLKDKTNMKCDRIVLVFPYWTLILLLDGGSSPQAVDTVNSHGHAEV